MTINIQNYVFYTLIYVYSKIFQVFHFRLIEYWMLFAGRFAQGTSFRFPQEILFHIRLVGSEKKSFHKYHWIFLKSFGDNGYEISSW